MIRIWIFVNMFAIVNILLPGHSTSSEPLRYGLTWVGNSLPGGNEKWVQNFFIHLAVEPDGTVNTWSHWDEGGRRFGIYRDGEVIGNIDKSPNSLRTTDQWGRKWEIHVKYLDPNHQEWEFVPDYVTWDDQIVEFPGVEYPMAINWSSDGLLMLADSYIGSRQQVLFFDVKDPDKPRLVREFGQRGGIGSGQAGVISPTKLWGIRGVGTDSCGNIYVAMSEQGSVLRSFTAGGDLRWELHGEFFCDLAVPDPNDDAKTVWGIQEKYAMDWTQPPGKDSRWTHYTLNRQRFPNDPRGLMHVKQQGEHGLTSPQIVYLKEKPFLFVGGMFASNFINIFRFENGMGVPSGLIMQWDGGLYNSDQIWPPNRPKSTFIWRDRNGDGDYQQDEFKANTPLVRPGPFHVDKSGNIWMAYGFFRYDLQGIDEFGNPRYSADHITPLEKPDGIGTVARLVYLDDSDTLVVAEEGSDMRHISRVVICGNYLAGSRQTQSFIPGAKENAGCMAAAGEYVFTGGWQERGKVWVNRLSDGREIGTLEPTELVGGTENTGWIDLLTGIAAFRRSDGEYLIFVEENARGKCLIYRWNPTDDNG